MAPSLPALPAAQAPGPSPWSNWVIPGRVLAGAYPASRDDVETEQLLSLLLELGVTTFVCLQAEVNIHIPEHSWRAGVGLRPYIRDAQRLLSRAQETGSTRISQRKLDFLHLPIIDGSVTTDSAMSRLADDCCERVLRGEMLYIHCWGGHGRTGTLVAVMLGRLYDLPTSTALRLTQAYHDTRIYPQGVRSPQTTVQRAQVKRLLLLPNSFAGVSHSSSIGAAAKPHPHTLQQSLRSPLAAPRAAAAAFTPGTPAKQPVVPSALARLSGRTAQPAAGHRAGQSSPSSTHSAAASAAAAAVSSASSARNINFSHALARAPGAAAAATSTSGSSSFQTRLQQHSTPGSAAAAGGIGGSSSRQSWSAAAGSSRVQTAATSPLLRGDVLRTPVIQSRLVQPVTHGSVRRQLVVDQTA